VARQYGLTSIPYIVLLDQNGQVFAQGNDARNWLSNQMVITINEIKSRGTLR
jgi:hypothetical protein